MLIYLKPNVNHEGDLATVICQVTVYRGVQKTHLACCCCMLLPSFDMANTR